MNIIMMMISDKIRAKLSFSLNVKMKGEARVAKLRKSVNKHLTKKKRENFTISIQRLIVFLASIARCALKGIVYLQSWDFFFQLPTARTTNNLL